MLVSFNEVLLTTRKALESLGWAQGDWEDGAAAIAWLALRDLPSVDAMLAELENLHDPYGRTLNRTKNVFDAKGQSCLRVGPLVIDAVYADSAETGWATAFLLNCTTPLFLLHYLEQCAGRDRQIIATWQDEQKPNMAWQVRMPPFTDQPELATYALATDAARVPGVHLVIAADAEFAMPTPDGELLELISAEFPRRAQQRLASGITIEDAAWEQLKVLARGILVPESAESRERGAGGV